MSLAVRGHPILRHLFIAILYLMQVFRDLTFFAKTLAELLENLGGIRGASCAGTLSKKEAA